MSSFDQQRASPEALFCVVVTLVGSRRAEVGELLHSVRAALLEGSVGSPCSVALRRAGRCVAVGGSLRLLVGGALAARRLVRVG